MVAAGDGQAAVLFGAAVMVLSECCLCSSGAVVEVNKGAFLGAGRGVVCVHNVLWRWLLAVSVWRWVLVMVRVLFVRLRCCLWWWLLAVALQLGWC